MPAPCIVSGNLQQLTAGVISRGKVVFQLANIGSGNPLGITGTALFPTLKYTVESDSGGAFTNAIWGNDNINPSNTLYSVTFRDSLGNEVGPVLYSITGGTFNLNSASAASGTTPPVFVNPVTVVAPVTVPFSATPTFNAATSNSFIITLTGNVTSSTLTGATAGQIITLQIIEDGTGGRTFAYPPNVKGGMSISTAANAVNTQSFWFDGTNAFALAPGTIN